MTREEKLSGGFSFTEDPLEDVDDLEDLNKLRDDLGMGGRRIRKISPLTKYEWCTPVSMLWGIIH